MRDYSVSHSSPVQRNTSLDVMKAIACVAVVLIHYNFKGDLGGIVKSVCRFAVPLFLMISGYFYRREYVLGRVSKLLKMLIGSTVFYAVYLYVWERMWKHGAPIAMADFLNTYLSASKLIKFFVTNDGLFNVMLWFIGALILCHLTVALFASDEKGLRRICWLIIPLIGMMSVVQEFAAVVGWRWTFFKIAGLTDRATVGLHAFFGLRALPFFLFGIWVQISGLQRKLPQHAVFYLALALIGCVLAPIEYVALGKRVAQFYVGSYITATALFLWALVSPSMKCSFLAYVGRSLSLLVYVLQLAVGNAVNLVARECHWWGKDWYNWSRCAIIIALTVLLSFLVHEVSARLCYRRKGT